MAIAGNLRFATGSRHGKKVSITNTTLTGTAAVVTGLTSVDAGGAQVTVQNAATTIPTDASAAVTSIAAGTVNVVVLTNQAANNIVSTTVTTKLGLVAIGV
jgi:hypothetical protein